MKNDLSEKQLLIDLGRRLERHRLNLNLTQQALAEQAGVSVITVKRIEKGASSQVLNLLKIMRTLGVLESLDQMIAEPLESPLQKIKNKGRMRQRARMKKTNSNVVKEKPWAWGEDA